MAMMVSVITISMSVKAAAERVGECEVRIFMTERFNRIPGVMNKRKYSWLQHFSHRHGCR